MFTLLQQILDLFIFRDSQLACNDVDCFVFFLLPLELPPSFKID